MSQTSRLVEELKTLLASTPYADMIDYTCEPLRETEGRAQNIYESLCARLLISDEEIALGSMCCCFANKKKFFSSYKQFDNYVLLKGKALQGVVKICVGVSIEELHSDTKVSLAIVTSQATLQLYYSGEKNQLLGYFKGPTSGDWMESVFDWDT